MKRTRVGWEGKKRTWPDPAWSSVLRPLPLGAPQAEKDLVPPNLTHPERWGSRSPLEFCFFF